MSNLNRFELELLEILIDLDELKGFIVHEEYSFHVPKEGEKRRKWRFDFAIPDIKVAFEVEGGIWTGGRHTNPIGFTKDCEKYNAATLQGWRVFRLTTAMINKDYVKSLLEITGRN